MTNQLRSASPVLKAILGYTIAEGVSQAEYDDWLWNVHYPDLLSNPYLEKIVLNTVTDTVRTTSAGTATANDPLDIDRIAELHFAGSAAYVAYREWFQQNPIPPERSPAGRTEFTFYVLSESVDVHRHE